MEEVRERLEQELRRVRDRLRQRGTAVVIEEVSGAVADNSALRDPWDDLQVQEEREVSFATRDLLVERANRLAEALERLRGGMYGTCEECGEPIAPARLQAMPEATTCVRCQDRLERTGERRGSSTGEITARNFYGPPVHRRPTPT